MWEAASYPQILKRKFKVLLGWHCNMENNKPQNYKHDFFFQTKDGKLLYQQRFVHEVLRQLSFLLSLLRPTNSKSRNLSWLMIVWNKNWGKKTKVKTEWFIGFFNWQSCQSTIGTKVNNNPSSCVKRDAFKNSGFKAGGNVPNKILKNGFNTSTN